MRLQLTLAEPKVARAVHVVLTSDPDASMDDVVAALNNVLPGPLFLDGRRLEGNTKLAESGLRNGAIISVAENIQERPVGDLQLAVVGGPAAGATFPLTIGETVVGSGANADIRIPDPTLARAHFRLRIEDYDEHVVHDMHTETGTLVEGRETHGRHQLSPEDVIGAGASLFEVRFTPDANADIRMGEDGELIFNRPARILPATEGREVVFPAKPEPPEKLPFPWLQAVLPLVLALVAASLFKSPYFLLFGLMSPVLLFGSFRGNRKQADLRYKRASVRYDEDFAKAASDMYEWVAYETKRCRSAALDAAHVLALALEPRRRLWERRRHDDDFLALRVGSSDHEPTLRVVSRTGEKPPEPPPLAVVPTTVALSQVGVMGVAGPPDAVRGMARWLIGQLAALHSPRDVRLWLFTDQKSQQHWEWVRWIPHIQFEDQTNAPFMNVANDQYQRDEHVKLLLRLVASRKEAMDNHNPVGPAIVVIYDGMRALRSMPGVVRLLKEGPEVQIYAIGLEDDAKRLAEEGKAEVVINQDGLRATLHITGVAPIANIIVDRVSGAWASRVARGMAALTEVASDDGERSLPPSVRLADLLDLDLDDHRQLTVKWALEARTTRATVGASVDGAFSLDIKRDGPHALVAGTTGAGKSEFLQSLVISLAMVNTPDAMNFVLVDYKGASAFADCERLIHTVGLVTNLDGRLTERALSALDAELKRRESALRALGAPDIDSAWDRNAGASADAGLARLILVIDEFAELVHELPDFVSGLIRIARVGRSLGVHLILATQRPSGVVSAEMKANTGLRVALRMEDRNDSTEVLDEGDAAYISRSTPGRAYARLGGGSSIVAFQTGRVAGKRKGVDVVAAPPEVLVMPWSQLGRPFPRSLEPRPVQVDTTDLRALVDMVNNAAADIGARAPRKPWLPPLPATFVLPQLSIETNEANEANERRLAVYGIEDRPAEQRQPAAAYDLVRGSHLAIVGSARSGRTTALRTLATSIAATWSPADCHIYALDFGNGGLGALAALPHCGAVTTRTDTDRINRLIERLMAEVARRQELMAVAGVGDISEQRRRESKNNRLPYLVVLLDRWEGFHAEFPADSGSAHPDNLARIMREGPSVGLRLFVTGDRQLTVDRAASHIEERIVLRMNNRDDYMSAGIMAKFVPEDMPTGRGIRSLSPTEVIDVQFGLLAPGSEAAVQNEFVGRYGASATAASAKMPDELRPFRVDALPKKIAYAELGALTRVQDAKTNVAPIVGVGGDELTSYRVDLLSDGPIFVVAGAPKTGRSSAALVMARSILDSGGRTVVLAPRPSPLQELEGADRTCILTGKGDQLDEFVAALNAGEGPVTVIVDDADVLNGSPIDEAIRVVTKQYDGKIGVVVVSTIEDIRTKLGGTISEARRSKVGLLFAPQMTMDGDILGVRIPRNLLGRSVLGRAILCRHGDVEVVQVPQP